MRIYCTKKRAIFSCLFLFSYIKIEADVINDRQIDTVQLNLCVVPTPGVKIPCDAPLDAQGNISTTDLRCFNDPKKFCIKCVEIVGKKPKTCQILDFDGKPIK